MKETEKIEIMHFSQEGYLEDGKNVYETGKKMTALADKVADEGYDAVFLMGVGGTWDELMQLEYLNVEASAFRAILMSSFALRQRNTAKPAPTHARASTIAVSYTHLDVYKRQGMGREQHRFCRNVR